MAVAGTRIRVPVVVACRVLGFSTQWYYKWLKRPVSRRDREDARVINRLVEIHEDDPTLGYRFLTDELEVAEIKGSENRAAEEPGSPGGDQCPGGPSATASSRPALQRIAR